MGNKQTKRGNKQTLRPEEPENVFVEWLADLAVSEIQRGSRHGNIGVFNLLLYM